MEQKYNIYKRADGATPYFIYKDLTLEDANKKLLNIIYHNVINDWAVEIDYIKNRYLIVVDHRAGQTLYWEIQGVDQL